MKKDALIEKLAEIEHNQWMHWAKDIATKEKISKERLERWKKSYVPYNELPEEMKEEDRIWARKVYNVLANKTT